MLHCVACLAPHWPLDPNWVFLNHGSFGACPSVVLEQQQKLRDLLERQPVDFFARQAEGSLDAARAALGKFLNADADDLAFVSNATTGVNTILRSLIDSRTLTAGDEILVTDHAYNACCNAVDAIAALAGLRVVVAHVPFPLQSGREVFDAIMNCVTPRTRLAMIDHVTSPTAVIMATPALVAELAARGVETLIDGAHAPGGLPLDLQAFGAAYYAGNCHKWLCAPKGAGFIYVRRDLQMRIRPLVISHGANQNRPPRSRFRLEFDWTGTNDFSPFLCIPAAIDFVGSLQEGGWPAVMKANHDLAVAARTHLCTVLGVEAPCPADMLTSMASVPLPDGEDDVAEHLRLNRIEVPLMTWPKAPRRWVRISAHLYNSMEQYHRLGKVLLHQRVKKPVSPS